MRSLIYTLAALAWLVSGNVAASYITMATGFSVTEGPDGMVLDVTTTNQGDESAYGIQFVVQIGKQKFTTASVPQLGVNQATSSNLSIQDAFSLPGRYPVLIKTHYQDANGHPFTALSVGFHDYQHSVVSKVLIQAEDASIPSNGKGTMKFTLRNNDSVERDLVLTLYLPDELATLKESDSLTIGPRQTRSLQYTIENFSALENSGYAIALLAEYDDGNSHYATAGSGTLRIAEPDTMAGYLPWVVAAIAAVILVFPIIIRLRRK
ncbi:MAG: hypothetical protein WBQ78_01630 [Gammaproteobacteria bacterium]